MARPRSECHLNGPVIDAGTTLHAGTFEHPVLRHYVRHTMDEPRPVDAILDIGAYEACPTGCLPIFSDGFESGDTLAWSETVP